MKCPDMVEPIMSAGRSDMELYQEALSCMELIASHLKTDMDYSVVSHLYQQCTLAITTLRTTHHNPHISESLESLLDTLSFQRNLVGQRNNGNGCDPRRVASDGAFKYGEYSHPSTSTSYMESGDPSEYLSFNKGSDDPMQDMLVEPASGQTGQLEDVVGLEDVKEVLHEAVVMPTKFPQLFQGGAKPWKRLLLYGPPGTGKTKLARALASELQCSFYSVSSASLLSAWVGGSEKLIRDLFQHARQASNQTFIFFDEIDCLCRKRSQAEDEHSRRVKSELLRQLEGAKTDEEQVFVLAATNCPWDLDPAFLRRFQRRIYVPLPHSDSRRAILEAQFNKSNLVLLEGEWQTLLTATEGHSGADLTHLATAAAFKPIRELQTARYWRFTDDNKITPCSSDTLGAMQYPLSKLPADKVVARDVELKDFLSALHTTPSTVPKEDLKMYQAFAGTNHQHA